MICCADTGTRIAMTKAGLAGGRDLGAKQFAEWLLRDTCDEPPGILHTMDWAVGYLKLGNFGVELSRFGLRVNLYPPPSFSNTRKHPFAIQQCSNASDTRTNKAPCHVADDLEANMMSLNEAFRTPSRLQL